MAQEKTFYCLRCQHRFPAIHEPKQVVERSCPRCGSNSVRLETTKAAARHAKSEREAVHAGDHH